MNRSFIEEKRVFPAREIAVACGIVNDSPFKMLFLNVQNLANIRYIVSLYLCIYIFVYI